MSSGSDPYGPRPGNPDPPSGALPGVGYQAYDPLTGAPLTGAGFPTGPATQGEPGQPAGGYPPAGYPPGYPGVDQGYLSGYPAAGDPAPGQPAPGYPEQPAIAYQNPAYQSPAYQGPAYQPPPPVYPVAGQLPPGYGYPAGQYPPGYPVAMPGYVLTPVGSSRPGGATAAAVLAFVQGAFALIGAFTMFAGSSAFGNLDMGSVTTEFTIVAVFTLVVGGLLIGGGAALLSRKSTVMVVACLASLAVSVYFVIRLSGVTGGSFAIWLPLLYAVLPIIALALTMNGTTRTWIRQR